MRAFTPLAVVCWGAHFGWAPLGETRFAFLGSIIAAIIVSILALGELVNDKRPEAGNRTAPLPFIGRVLLAALCGGVIFLAARQTWMIGALAAVFGAILGTYGGFLLRRALVRRASLPDLAVALCEDAVAIGGSLIVAANLF